MPETEVTGIPAPAMHSGRTPESRRGKEPAEPIRGRDELVRVVGLCFFGLLTATLAAAAVWTDKAAVLTPLAALTCGMMLVLILFRDIDKFSIGLKGMQGEMRREIHKVETAVGEVSDRLRDLERMQQERAYDINHDLLRKRSDAYGNLWGTMAPSAIFSEEEFDRKRVGDYSKALTNWYFSRDGGLYLTERSREFYFPLQRLLADIVELPDGSWDATARTRTPDTEFKKLLGELPVELKTMREAKLKEGPDDKVTEARLMEWTAPDPETGRLNLAELPHEDWGRLCRVMSAKLRLLAAEASAETEGARLAAKKQLSRAVFCVVQQVSSVLRTVLTEDVGSRENAYLPRVEPPVEPAAPGVSGA